MDTKKRNELIDTYYNAIDTEIFADFDRTFTPDIEYLYPGEPSMHGVETVQSFFEERRKHSNSTHEIERRISDDETTVCEGTITAEKPDGETFKAGFVGVFTFDRNTEAIGRVGVYTR